MNNSLGDLPDDFGEEESTYDLELATQNLRDYYDMLNFIDYKVSYSLLIEGYSEEQTNFIKSVLTYLTDTNLTKDVLTAISTLANDSIVEECQGNTKIYFNSTVYLPDDLILSSGEIDTYGIHSYLLYPNQFTSKVSEYHIHILSNFKEQYYNIKDIKIKVLSNIIDDLIIEK